MLQIQTFTGHCISDSVTMSSIAVSNLIFKNGNCLGRVLNKTKLNFLSIYTVVVLLEISSKYSNHAKNL